MKKILYLLIVLLVPITVIAQNKIENANIINSSSFNETKFKMLTDEELKYNFSFKGVSSFNFNDLNKLMLTTITIPIENGFLKIGVVPPKFLNALDSSASTDYDDDNLEEGYRTYILKYNENNELIDYKIYKDEFIIPLLYSKESNNKYKVYGIIKGSSINGKEIFNETDQLDINIIKLDIDNKGNVTNENIDNLNLSKLEEITGCASNKCTDEENKKKSDIISDTIINNRDIILEIFSVLFEQYKDKYGFNDEMVLPIIDYDYDSYESVIYLFDNSIKDKIIEIIKDDDEIKNIVERIICDGDNILDVIVEELNLENYMRKLRYDLDNTTKGYITGVEEYDDEYYIKTIVDTTVELDSSHRGDINTKIIRMNKNGKINKIINLTNVIESNININLYKYSSILYSNGYYGFIYKLLFQKDFEILNDGTLINLNAYYREDNYSQPLPSISTYISSNNNMFYYTSYSRTFITAMDKDGNLKWYNQIGGNDKYIPMYTHILSSGKYIVEGYRLDGTTGDTLYDSLYYVLDYDITLLNNENNIIDSSALKAPAGQKVTLKINDKSIKYLEITTDDGKNVEVTKISDDEYEFIMPNSRVTVNPVSKKSIINPNTATFIPLLIIGAFIFSITYIKYSRILIRKKL